nr:phospholipid-binding lipoprotein MlaA [Raoultella terrigena]
MRYKLSLFIFWPLLLSGCTRSGAENIQHQRSDPLEPFNRVMFNFNMNIMDPYLLRPVAVAWRHYVPQPARSGLSHFTSNLEEPAVMVNYLLQGKPRQAMIHFTRFFLNTTLGMGGLIDVAGMANPQLQRSQPRRFGSTLGHYGVSYGPYMQLPLYGSFTLRDDGGDIADNFYPALSWLTWPVAVSAWIAKGIETRAQLLDSDGLLNLSSDPYILVREAYFQNHNFIVSDGSVPPADDAINQVTQDDLKSIDLP